MPVSMRSDPGVGPGHEQKEGRFAKDMSASVEPSTGKFVFEIPDIPANSCYIALFSGANSGFSQCQGRLHDLHS
jgi:hypothetical protein